jgi:putative addiction module component (TIGR02574 family)
MAKLVKLPPPGFEDLSIEEKIDYVQSLWDHIAADVNTVPLTEWQKQVLEKRLAAYEEDPDAGVPWEELRERLRSKLASGGG